MGKKRAALSKGETVVASALWRLSSASLGEIYEEVAQHHSMEYSTVQSYIRRLETKGYVKSKKVGRNNVYSAKVKPDQVIGQTLDQMLNQMFAGDAIPIFRHLIRERGISDEEMLELRQMLDDADDANDDESNGERHDAVARFFIVDADLATRGAIRRCLGRNTFHKTSSTSFCAPSLGIVFH